jgi:hypothetical protein
MLYLKVHPSLLLGSISAILGPSLFATLTLMDLGYNAPSYLLIAAADTLRSYDTPFYPPCLIPYNCI